MPPFLISLLFGLLLVSGCTSTGDVLGSAAMRQTKFQDSDPQDFGARHPGHHDVHGIDVSKWNGQIDWQKVKQSGVAFAFIKATEGTDRIDPTFVTNWRNSAAAGVPHAPYHFYYFCSSADEQADWFIANVPKASMHLPPVLDAEWNSASPTCKTRPDAETVRRELQRFLDRIEAHYGKRPIIYTSVDFHRDNLVGHFGNYHFWVRSVAAHPEKVYVARRWAFWQYTATGIVPGIEGKTDINAFAGTEKSWRQWVATASN
ncbi:GH25 family lysozyme [Rhizobium sp. FY34]|uniref:glycoside hydrolase family 25 protein n=1 Tax=Rhizobium sp. FY34 TaxID=2562309 RepID=UPI0010BF6B08|nr:GH25 family lysozyme [Rhizobium sp. FY34]